ncbi:ABC transporter permease subunit, partial [candidate division KSB1 bacterium]|nr:ABC transporter permease subunit [candidate division KSB1 bacterium]
MYSKSVPFAQLFQFFPFKGIFETLVDLPLIIPATAAGLTILMLYGSLGILGKLFGEAGINIMFAFPAILTAHVFMTLPFVVRAVGPVLAAMDRTEQDAAKILGANEVQVFAKVIFPAIKSALITGCVFTFIRSMGELGATIIVAGNLALNSQTAPLFVFSEFNEGNLVA